MSERFKESQSLIESSRSPFPYLLYREFIDAESCQKLIGDAESFSNSSSRREVMGGRALLPNTSSTFRDLVHSSKEWQSLERLLNSPEFLAMITNGLALKVRYSPIDVYTNRSGKFVRVIQRIRESAQNTPLANASARQIFALSLLRTIHASRRVFSGTIARLRGRVAYEMLFDYSRARNGYVREIHRDSDARDIVFLIYFNSTAASDGGALRLHRLNPGTQVIPRPDPSHCSLEREIVPSAGTLVAFENTACAYHSVERIVGTDTQRHFVYGAVTRLVGRSSGLHGEERLKTDWRIYT